MGTFASRARRAQSGSKKAVEAVRLFASAHSTRSRGKTRVYWFHIALGRGPLPHAGRITNAVWHLCGAVDGGLPTDGGNVDGGLHAVTVLAPAGGEIWAGGQHQLLSWTGGSSSSRRLVGVVAAVSE